MTEPQDLVTDLEVTVRCPIGNLKANPHWPGNRVVLAAHKFGSAAVKSEYYSNPVGTVQARTDHVRVLVGHNLAFDLQWHIRYGIMESNKLTLWDTALAEYVLSGQESKMPSLNQLCQKYGLPVKDEKVKAYWDAGKDTTDIPKEILIPYGEGDVQNTYFVYQKQLVEAHKAGLLKLIFVLNVDKPALYSKRGARNATPADIACVKYIKGNSEVL